MKKLLDNLYELKHTYITRREHLKTKECTYEDDLTLTGDFKNGRLAGRISELGSKISDIDNVIFDCLEVQFKGN